MDLVVSAVRDFETNSSTSLKFFFSLFGLLFPDQSQNEWKNIKIPMKKYRNTTSNFSSLQPNTSAPEPRHTHRNPPSKFLQKIIQKKRLLVRNPQLFDRVGALARQLTLPTLPAMPGSFRRRASERGVVKIFDWHACYWLRQCSCQVFDGKKIAWVPHKTGYCKRGHESPLG